VSRCINSERKATNGHQVMTSKESSYSVGNPQSGIAGISCTNDGTSQFPER